MKYNKQKFCDAPNHVKINIIKNELSLTTHNGLSKDDLLMLLDWCYNRLIKGDLYESKSIVSERGKWILCSERLPENKERVLIKKRMGHVSIGFCNVVHKDWREDGYPLPFDHVLAWQPLPKYYKED